MPAQSIGEATLMSGAWFDAWVSGPRFARYLEAANGDRHRARRLYDWNTELSSAFLHDFAHLEVGLRNSFDRALTRGAVADDDHWTRPSSLVRLFPSAVSSRSGRSPQRDPQAVTRRKVEEAALRAGRGDRVALPGRVVAELSFGFWTQLTSDRHEKSLWVPYLHRAYPAGTSRHAVRDALEELRVVRNRIAHHEHLLRGGELHRRRLLDQVRRLSEGAAVDLVERSRVAEILTRRP
ncbi:Abi-like protein [Frondihabitans australicus]|uniref:Abi-like protein n=1 Tax=Frondihabitans australicus TaxID=386892 RepID=A0A495IKX7_9MICO|nr:Abi-like protein [Frondihabitans australicus]